MTYVMLSQREAERLTERIKLTVESIDNGMFKLRNLLEEARDSNAWQVLGYPSWTAYLVSLFDRPIRLGRDDRQVLVSYLSGEGLSTRAIAPIVGVARNTVMADLKQVAQSEPPDPQGAGSGDAASQPAAAETPQPPATGDSLVNLATGEVIEPTVVEHTVTEKTKTVTGLDGKTYPVKPTAPRRRSLVDDARTANRELFRAIERVRDIRRDDRYTRNKADILAALQPSVDLALEVLNDL